jgi:ATP-dependent protease Clp ATPase subunit
MDFLRSRQELKRAKLIIEVVQMYDSVSARSRQRIEEKIEEMRDKQTREAVQEVLEFNRTPSDLKGQVDKFVIGQEKGKKASRQICYWAGKRKESYLYSNCFSLSEVGESS